MLARNCDLCWLATSSCRLLSPISLNRRAFWIASTDWAAKVCSRLTVVPGNSPGALRRTTSAPMTLSAPSKGTISNARKPARTTTSSTSEAGSLRTSAIWTDRRCAAACPTPASPRRICRSRDRGDQVLVHAVGRAQAELFLRLVIVVDRAGIGAGKLHRLGDDRAQDFVEVERSVDRLADLAERAQLFDRLRQLGGAGAQLVEQAHVLDGDHGLVGEAREQFDLLVREWPHGRPVERDDADDVALLEHRHGDIRARTGELGGRARQRGIAADIGTVHDFLAGDHALDGGARRRRFALALAEIRRHLRLHAKMSWHAQRAALVQEQRAKLRFADAGRILQHGVEHRLQIARRA